MGCPWAARRLPAGCRALQSQIAAYKAERFDVTLEAFFPSFQPFDTGTLLLFPLLLVTQEPLVAPAILGPLAVNIPKGELLPKLADEKLAGQGGIEDATVILVAGQHVMAFKLACNLLMLEL